MRTILLIFLISAGILYSQPCFPPSPFTPQNGSAVSTLTPNLCYNFGSSNLLYVSLSVATDSLFSNIIYTQSSIPFPSGCHTLPGGFLQNNTWYWWKMAGTCPMGTYSSTTYKFITNTWDTTAAKFYPLRVGNVYLFKHYELRFGCSQNIYLDTRRVEIVDFIMLANGHKFYKFNGWWNSYPLQPSWNYQRIDSGTMNVYTFDTITNSEVLIDSLLASLNNGFNGGRLTAIEPKTFFRNEFQENYLGNIRKIKTLNCNPFTISNWYKLVEGIGFTEFTSCEIGYGDGFFLKGCVIDGVVYGDTTLTGIHQINSTIPKSFYLSQNYPNPFNPKSKINYSIPTTQYTILKVFDALGKEVATLVNQKQNAGSYEVEFDGNELPGGVYFYKLWISTLRGDAGSPREAGDFAETKRMILLK